jgi:hypothetical protein
MPYKIKEKKGKKFSVVNKETGKVMSKGTTEKKAKNQIKAIYANMRPEHRIRHRIGLMEGASIKHPVHRAIINDVKKVLKKEEIYGGGNALWNWFVSEFPVLAMVITGTKPSDVVKAVETYGPEAIGVLLEPAMFPVAVYEATHHSPYPSPYHVTEEEQFAHLHDYSQDYEEDNLYEEDIEDEIFDDEEENIVENVTNQVTNNITNITEEKDDTSVVEKVDKLVEKIMKDEGIDDGQRHGLDDALRFPMIYNYDENNKPMYLQEWLLSSGVAGRNFAVEEFGNTVRNQEPYAFLNFPINGGRLGKINYSKLGYSRY